ncbi:hypothetical protein [Streptacidiphilus sp. EB103A]|uniref:hypothetical protein n=1 Tax=Streptacidiphilus sp. EB103A TaxID=3156275 RepID=UPI0035122DF1
MPEPRWSRVTLAELPPQWAAPVEPSDPGRARPVSRPQDEPIYSQLAAEWRGNGRTLPGGQDREWAELVARRTWR